MIVLDSGISTPYEERIAPSPSPQDPKITHIVNKALKIVGLFFCCLGGTMIAFGHILPAVAFIVVGVASLIFGFVCDCNETVVSLGEIEVSDNPERSTTETLADMRYRECLAGRSLSGAGAGISRTSMVHFSLLKHFLKEEYAEALEDMKRPLDQWELYQSRAAGLLLGMACGDAQGAGYEFLPYKKEFYQPREKQNRFQLKEGQWTDATSMGLCLADTLIQEGENGDLDEMQLMLAFTDWWYYGYNNAFTVGDERGSIGLGGNIGQAFEAFTSNRDATGRYQTSAGDKFTSGNGSLMRMGAVAIYALAEIEACQLARAQSRVTHQGDEAADCCATMASILFLALHDKQTNCDEVRNSVFERLELLPIPGVEQESVKALARCERFVNPQTQEMENWDWKKRDFTFNQKRVEQQPGYVGSYAMDALAMALHCVYTTTSFEDAVTKAASRGGDADTVAAITGQIAGAIYGLANIPKQWRNEVQQWDRGGEIVLRAVILSHPFGG